MAGPAYATVVVNEPTADEVDAFRRELESVLRRRVYLTEVIAYAVGYARGNAEKIVQRELEPA